MRKMITLNEASEQTGFSDSYLRRLLRSGTIQGQKVGARLWVLDQKTVDRLAKIPYRGGRPRGKISVKA